jgi:putative endopeptidase
MNTTLDLSIDPLDDFDNYVNGIWKKNNGVPDDQVNWGTFNILREKTIQDVKIILEDLAFEKHNKNHVLGLLYKFIVSSQQNLETTTKKNINKYLKLIDKIETIEDICIVIAFLTKIGINTFFEADASEDPKDASIVKLILSSVHLSLPEREYYLDLKYSSYVEGFKSIVVKIFEYFGYDVATSNKMSDDVLMLEQLLAVSMKSITERRNIDKIYYKTTINNFVNEMKNTVWKTFFHMLEINSNDDFTFIILDLSYFKKITYIMQHVSISIIKNYMKYITITSLGHNLIDKLDHILFDFFGRQLEGQPIIEDRSKRTIKYFNTLIISEIIGKEYLERMFDENTRTSIINSLENMVSQVKYQLKISIENSFWLHWQTKQKALLKLETLNTKIGYPSVWRNDTLLLAKLKSKLCIDNPDIFNSIVLIKNYNFTTNVLNIIDEPKDPNKWYTFAHEVNAYYSPQRNEIVFPMGILQKPFYDKDQTLAQNYGAIGTIIGHEIIHGYDDQGRKYDHLGNMTNWWTDVDLQKFKTIANKMVEQYSAYSINGMHINGSLTLGENLADLGGVNLALRAMMRVRSISNENSNVLLDQRDFFISYANVWKKIDRPPMIIERLLSDFHSIEKYRIYTVRNIDEFYDVFDRKVGKYNDQRKMYLQPSLRIKMW